MFCVWFGACEGDPAQPPSPKACAGRLAVVTRRRFVVLVAAIAAVAFAGRAVYILAATDKPLGFGDQLYYRDAAVGLAHGDPFRAVIPFVPPHAVGWPEAEHPPLTALVLAPAAWI